MVGLVLIVALAACGPGSPPGGDVAPDAGAPADAAAVAPADADTDETRPGIPVGRFEDIWGSETAICARDRHGERRCWDADGRPVAGADPAGAGAAPPAELGPGRYTDVAVSPGNACGVRDDGTIRCAAAGEWVEPPDDRFTKVAVSSAWRCGLARSGRVRCWEPAGPALLTPARDVFLDVAASRDQICGLLETRMLRCWGGVAGPIEPPAPHGEGVELRGLRVESGAKVQDLTGLSVSFEYRMPGADFDETGWLAGRLELSQKGRKSLWVKAALSNAWYRDSRGRARVKARLQADSNDEWQASSLFFPFCDMDLPPGDHRVRIDLKARRVPEFGRPIDSTPLLAEPLEPVAFAKPGATKLRVGVRSAKVPEGDHEGMTMDERQQRPDLSWSVELRGDRTIKLFTSPEVSDRFAASWTVDSPPFVASEGDLVTIRVVDRDIVLHDEMMLFRLTAKQLVKATGPLVARPGAQIVVVAAPVR
jgi:hypothetical protein